MKGALDFDQIWIFVHWCVFTSNLGDKSLHVDAVIAGPNNTIDPHSTFDIVIMIELFITDTSTLGTSAVTRLFALQMRTVSVHVGDWQEGYSLAVGVLVWIRLPRLPRSINPLLWFISSRLTPPFSGLDSGHSHSSPQRGTRMTRYHQSYIPESRARASPFRQS